MRTPPASAAATLLAALVLSRATAAWGDVPQPPERTDQPPDQPPPPTGDPAEPPASEPTEPVDDREPVGELGPLLVIEKIRVEGNTATQPQIISRALGVAAGDALHASDPRLELARFKVLALGFFRDARLRLERGSARGRVVLVVTVVERGTIVLNRLWFGTTELAPYWVGADLTERNLFGLGVAVGGGFIYSGYADIAGGRNQWAAEIRAGLPTLRGSRFGAQASLTMIRGAEAYRVSGVDGNPELSELAAFPFRRIGGRAGITYDVSPLTRLSVSGRIERISTELPIDPTVALPDGQLIPIDLQLKRGTSGLTTLGLVYDRDDRPDPILSHSGTRIALGGELGALFSDYQFASVFGRFEHYWPLRNERHAIALKIAGGVIVGNAPRFERIHVSDVNHMLTPRANGLVLSASAPLDILSKRKPSYGDLGGQVTGEYVMQLFRGKGKARVYGGDLFFGAGLWMLSETADLRARDSAITNAQPVDLYLDAGVRLDTDIGIFELTIANALGRVR